MYFVIQNILFAALAIVFTVGLYKILLAIRAAREDWLKGKYD